MKNHSQQYLALLNSIRDKKDQKVIYKRLYLNTLFSLWKDIIKFNYKYNLKELIKKKLIFGIIFGSILTSMYFYYKPPQYITSMIKTNNIVYLEDSNKTHTAFIDKFKFIESRNNPKIINQYGYLGYFQFGRSALETVGLGSVTDEQFLNNPELQECAFLMLLKHNKNKMSSYIGRYQSKTINGIYITESSILAGCHLGGCQSMIDFLESNGSVIFKDGNGTPITKYLEEFQGYKLKL